MPLLSVASQSIYPGIPYGHAPGWAFALAEYSMYLLFILCLWHALKRSKRDVFYLSGGLAFGLLLEYLEVLSGSYTYGRFSVMLGKAPLDIPLCIGTGWGIIMYTARLFSDRLGLSFWACVALDTLLALNIDLSMDTVAYRLHMWHWNWQGTGLNPLTAQWFGIPYGNFIGWQTVVFCYSAFSRLFERSLMPGKDTISKKFALMALLALVCSLGVLFGTELYLFPVLDSWGIRSLQRFAGISIILLILTFWQWRRRAIPATRIPAVAWWVPAWFHLYFFACFFIFGFYLENRRMLFAACLNLVVGAVIHLAPLSFKKNDHAGVIHKLSGSGV